MANRKTVAAANLTIAGVEYVVIPKADYLRMRAATQPRERVVDAHSFVRGSLAEGLRAAREAAGLTQGEVAARMGKSQTLVSQAESGTARVSERYVRAVLEACGLPEDWNGQKPERIRKAPTRKRA